MHENWRAAILMVICDSRIEKRMNYALLEYSKVFIDVIFPQSSWHVNHLTSYTWAAVPYSASVSTTITCLSSHIHTFVLYFTKAQIEIFTWRRSCSVISVFMGMFNDHHRSSGKGFLQGSGKNWRQLLSSSWMNAPDISVVQHRRLIKWKLLMFTLLCYSGGEWLFPISIRFLLYTNSDIHGSFSNTES